MRIYMSLVVAICIWTIFLIWRVGSAPLRAKNEARKIAGPGQWFVQDYDTEYDTEGNLSKVILCLQNREEKKNTKLVFGGKHCSLWLIRTLDKNDVVNLVFVENPKSEPKQLVESYLSVEKWD